MKKIGIIVLVLIGMLLSFGSGFLFSEALSVMETEETTKTKETTVASTSKKQELVLVNNDIVKVSFIEIFEEPSVANTCYVRLKIVNKSDETVMVSLTESYVNGYAQPLSTGVPIVLAPGKSSQQPFFFGYGNLGITDKGDISEIEFKVLLMDEDTYDTVLETDSLIITKSSKSK